MSKRSKKTEEKCFAFTESKSKKETYDKTAIEEKIDAAKEDNNRKIEEAEGRLRSRDVYYFNAGDMGARGIYDFLQIGFENGVMNANNARMTFSLNESNRDKYKNIPPIAKNLGNFIGIREVAYKSGSSASNAHILVKLTEMYPEVGRIHFSFLNYGNWTEWKTISTDIKMSGSAIITSIAQAKMNNLKRDGKIISFNCVMATKTTIPGGRSGTVATLPEYFRPIGRNVEIRIITNNGIIASVIIQTNGEVILNNINESVAIQQSDYFIINEMWMKE